MTDDRSLERAARSWIEVGPTAAPPHVVDTALDLIAHTPQERDWIPWRFPRMSLSARVVALVAIGALILGGAFALLGPGRPSTALPSPVPSSSPPASSSASAPASAGLDLSGSFSSLMYGYTVKYPGGWKSHPATRMWTAGAVNTWGSGFNDELFLTGGDVRFSGASQALATGQSADQWLTAYAAGADRASWRAVPIGGETGYVTSDGVAAAGGTIAPGGRMFDLVVVSGDRAYNFNMDGNVDRPTFEAFLATITLDPASVGALPPLEETFASPFYGYSISYASDWTVRPATAHWQGVDNAPPATDDIVIAGTDTTVSAASQALGSQSLDDFLVPFHANTTANVPPGCDGGDPSTWASTRIGSETGRWYQLCNAAEAIVAVGGRVYVFTWSNSTFDGGTHMNLVSWLKLLETMSLDPGSAVDR
jgi:hypothetical protein